jgi:hypothetical protein
MALEKTISKVFPTESQLSVRLVLTDDDRADLGAGAQTVIDEIVSENYSTLSAEVRNELGRKVQKLINDYKSNRTTFTGAAYNTIVNWIDTNVSV